MVSSMPKQESTTRRVVLSVGGPDRIRMHLCFAQIEVRLGPALAGGARPRRIFNFRIRSVVIEGSPPGWVGIILWWT